MQKPIYGETQSTVDKACVYKVTQMKDVNRYMTRLFLILDNLNKTNNQQTALSVLETLSSDIQIAINIK
jgi:hypothetical protein